MKVSSTITIAVVSLMITGLAQARPNHHGYDRGNTIQRYESQRHDGRHRDGPRHSRDVVRLDLPVHVRGDGRVRLRRLINRHYRINLDHYRLRKVVVDNHGRRHSMGRLRVGKNVSHPQQLYKGRNVLKVPNQGFGKWVLRLDNARVNNIRVVLEPRQQWAHQRSPRRAHHPGYNDRRRGW